MAAPLNPNDIRGQFPILDQEVNGNPLVYLDSAATTQKPRAVIDAIVDYYERYNSNIHRGVHTLSQRATDAYEKARESVRRFLNAPDAKDIVFVRGTTEAVNLVAHSFVRPRLSPGDEIVISGMEHHSNIVPWQLILEETGAVLKPVPFNDAGELDLAAFEEAITEKTKFVSLVHVSNSLGTINPVKEVVERAHSRGVPVFLDGAQAAGHEAVDVQALDCDFYAISGHKLYGPTGIGALYGKAEVLESMQPYQGGGEMITRVTFEDTKFHKVPHRFEAGTPNIVGSIGLGAAIEWVESVGIENIAAYEHELLEYATEALSVFGDNIRVIGTAEKKAGILSFVVENAHPHDVGTILDQEGVAVRAGHHCAQPVMQRYDVAATVRASFAVYNTREDVDALVRALKKVEEIFGACPT